MQKFGASKMHSIIPVAPDAVRSVVVDLLFIVALIVCGGVCGSSLFCCAILCAFSSLDVIKLEYSFRLKIKYTDYRQAVNHCALF